MVDSSRKRPVMRSIDFSLLLGWTSSWKSSAVAVDLGRHDAQVMPLQTQRAHPDSRFASSQWETSLQCNAVSHWLGANLESALLPHTHCISCISILEITSYIWLVKWWKWHPKKIWQLTYHCLSKMADIFIIKRIFSKDLFFTLIQISPIFSPNDQIGNMSALVRIMTNHYLNQGWTSPLTHICVTR